MLLRHLARPMLATWFIYDGVQAAISPRAHVPAAQRGVGLVGGRMGVQDPLSERQVAQLVRVHGAATAVAGLCLAVGKAPRTASFALAVLTVPLAVVDQPFTSGEGTRGERTGRFVRRVGAIGAALIAGADNEGRPGVQWRIEKARADLARAAEANADAIAEKGRRARRAAKKAARVGQGGE